MLFYIIVFGSLGVLFLRSGADKVNQITEWFFNVNFTGGHILL